MKKFIVIFLFNYMTSFGQSPNYSEDIAPIIYNKCLQCHHTGGIDHYHLKLIQMLFQM